MNRRAIKNKRNVKKQKKRKKSIFKRVLIFLIYELVIISIATPLMVFYGPFENVKKTIVGTAMATFKHQYIATTFLSKDEIDKIIKNDNLNGVSNSEKENELDVQIQHKGNKTIERYEVHARKFDAYILEIKDPSRIKIGYTKNIGKMGQRTSEIAEQNKAIAAINGGGFTDRSSDGRLWAGTGAYPEGIVISNGKIIYSDAKEYEKLNVTAFTEEGKLIVGEKTLKELKDRGVKEALSFRNTLVINGQPCKVEVDEGLNPRTAIGQKKDGTIVFLVIDGRRGFKQGATLREIQNLLIKRGVWNASNLDGGSSSTMYYDGEVINSPCNWDGERSVATAIYAK
ncbi:hypothetical protein CLOACE_05750 [Clostridium acetireducens DSM 10703]|jgi:exopolysaccharide biosynthesis protein|uniref:Phosphodiester glycosidase domain-containing protein n=1 Tax=Clostridium acetireducens DSM 10703 TaxID=1121290 RepID=A0A1E8F1F3_9CLOT|nr:phosphodiester glycosidase family protein [Clostridium acetireducens]OFI06989.1 hypothetical protein CLOACE_05750 [Clostridium acetireducens DSM 10703]